MNQFLKSLSFFILSILLSGGIVAQSSKLQQGMENFMGGKYERALEYLTIAISQDKTLTSDMLAEAYYYRGLTYIRLHNEAFTGDDKNLQKQYKDAVLLAYRDYKSSLGYDNGTLWKQIDLEIKNLHHPMLQEGLTLLNEYNTSVFNGKPDPKLLSRAEDYLTSAHEIRETYIVCDLLGQVYLDKSDKHLAAEYFSKSEKLYTDKLPEQPDFLMAYVFYRLAAIHKSEDVRLAMQDNQRGLNFLQSEFDRYLLMKDKLSDEQVKQMDGQYKLARKDLNNLRLDLYLSDSILYVEAIHVFEEELGHDPGNVDLLVGYASLLEKTDKDKAIEVYRKALKADPENPIALFNTGALYYAKGRDLYETARETTDDNQFKILAQVADSNFVQAQPYFEKALEADPGSIEAIQALKTIAFVLDNQQAYEKYQQMESTLKK
jgi:tetratricopeptide (TPR) repeat protein